MLESKITKEYLDLKSLQKSLLTHMIQFSHCLFVTNLELWVDMYVLPWDRLFVLASIVKPWVEPVFHGIFTLSWEYGTFLIHSTSKHLLRWILNNKIELNFSYAYADSDLFWLQSAFGFIRFSLFASFALHSVTSFFANAVVYIIMIWKVRRFNWAIKGKVFHLCCMYCIFLSFLLILRGPLRFGLFMNIFWPWMWSSHDRIYQLAIVGIML